MTKLKKFIIALIFAHFIFVSCSFVYKIQFSTHSIEFLDNACFTDKSDTTFISCQDMAIIIDGKKFWVFKWIDNELSVWPALVFASWHPFFTVYKYPLLVSKNKDYHYESR